MAIQEQTGRLRSPAQLTRPAPVQVPAPAQGPGSATTAVPGAEWTAHPLRPIARWVLVPQQAGAARLEMVWSVPDPQSADALR
jgi:hypothetical protein